MVKKRKDFEQYETVVLCMTFPLMSLLPGTSHDYRLPICVIPFLLLIANTELQEQKDKGLFLVGALLISFTTALLLSPRSFFLFKTEALLVQFVIYGLLAAKIKWGGVPARMGAELVDCKKDVGEKLLG